MPYQLSQLLGDAPAFTDASFREQIEKLLNTDGPRFRRLWAYYRNTMRVCGVPAEEQGAERPYREAQEWGLPSRITGQRSGVEMFAGTRVDQVARKEVVIENDIGWRIDTSCDYLFGKPIVINSAAPDPARRAIIEQLVRQILAHNGGIVFFQQLALLGAVHGFIDVLVKFDATQSDSSAPDNSALSTESSALSSAACGTSDLGQPPMDSSEPTPDAAPSGTESDAAARSPHVSAGPDPRNDEPAIPGASIPSPEALTRLARRIRLEIVEPARALPILSQQDYRCVQAYAQVYAVDQCRMTRRRRAGPAPRSSSGCGHASHSQIPSARGEMTRRSSSK